MCKARIIRCACYLKFPMQGLTSSPGALAQMMQALSSWLPVWGCKANCLLCRRPKQGSPVCLLYPSWMQSREWQFSSRRLCWTWSQSSSPQTSAFDSRWWPQPARDCRAHHQWDQVSKYLTVVWKLLHNFQVSLWRLNLTTHNILLQREFESSKAHWMPVVRDLFESHRFADVDQVQNVFLETRAPKADWRIQESGSYPCVSSDGMRHLQNSLTFQLKWMKGRNTMRMWQSH